MHSPRLREYVRTADARGMNGAGTQCAGRGALLWEIDPGRRVEGGCPAKNPPLAVYRPVCEGSKMARFLKRQLSSPKSRPATIEAAFAITTSSANDVVAWRRSNAIRSLF